MAMNKAEKARMEAALIAASFYRTAPIERDLPPPDHSMRHREGKLPAGYGLSTGSIRKWENGIVISMGWDFNTYNLSVSKACSSSVSHSKGSWDGTTSQGSRTFYSSKLLALRALRHAIEQDVCEKLWKVDCMIEKELESEQPKVQP